MTKVEKSTRAIILAAGEGTRLKKYTEHLPKGMLEFAGKSLLERQIAIFREAGIDDIVIVKGFAEDKIDFPDITYYINVEFDSTNMLVSLFKAEEKLEGDVVVSYADILFDVDLLRGLLESEKDIAVTVDREWERYWRMRYGAVDFDTESLKLDGERITELGVEGVGADEIDARYVGLIKFSALGVEKLKRVWHKFKDEFWEKPWQVSGKPLRNAYFTDMLQALIDEGEEVSAYMTCNGWIEFDTNEDYEKAIGWQRDGSLSSLIDMD